MTITKTKKIKKSVTPIRSTKKDHFSQKLSNDLTKQVSTKVRTDGWINELMKNDGTSGSKEDAIKVMDYLKKEMAYLKKYQANAATCRLNQRMAVH